jgi:heme-degrading monooxygenase HmoA
MVHLLIHHTVQDYHKWKPLFDGHASFRAQMGSKGGKVFRSASNPNEVFVLLAFGTLDTARKFTQSDNLKEVMKNAGILGMPEIHFVEEAGQTAQ